MVFCEPCLSVSCSHVLASQKMCFYTLMCRDMLNKPQALNFGQGEHPEPEITVRLGLCEGRRFLFA